MITMDVFGVTGNFTCNWIIKAPNKALRVLGTKDLIGPSKLKTLSVG